ncbi:MAG: hypothetical protein JRN15_23510 [Nitrososphaerota archaeon]|nr:hypothetical protein [Nitrososphaerota archaeon]
MSVASRATLYVGILLATIGCLWIASVWIVGVSFTQSLCNGGLSPQPDQGCGYIPYLVLYVWGENSSLQEGFLLALIGSVILAARWFVFRFRNHHVSHRGTMFTFAVLAIVVLVGSTSLYTSSQILRQQESSNNATNEVLSQCPVQWPPELPGPNTTQLETVQVVAIPAGVQSKLCIEYVGQMANTAMQSLDATVHPETNISQIVSSATVSLTVEPKILSPQNIPNEIPVLYVVFTITTSGSGGLYVLSLPGICPTIPLAVGYSQVNYTMISNWWHNRNICASSGQFSASLVSATSNVATLYAYIPLDQQ